MCDPVTQACAAHVLGASSVETSEPPDVSSSREGTLR